MENDTGSNNGMPAKVLPFQRKIPTAPVPPPLDGTMSDRMIFMMGLGQPLKKDDVVKIIEEAKLKTFHIQMGGKPKTLDELIEHLLVFRETITAVGHAYLYEVYRNIQEVLHALTVMLEIQRLEYTFGLSYIHTPFGASVAVGVYLGPITEQKFIYQDTFHSNCDLDFTED